MCAAQQAGTDEEQPPLHVIVGQPSRALADLARELGTALPTCCIPGTPPPPPRRRAGRKRPRPTIVLDPPVVYGARVLRTQEGCVTCGVPLCPSDLLPCATGTGVQGAQCLACARAAHVAQAGDARALRAALASRVRAANARGARRARALGTPEPAQLSIDEASRLWEEQAGVCASCGAAIELVASRMPHVPSHSTHYANGTVPQPPLRAELDRMDTTLVDSGAAAAAAGGAAPRSYAGNAAWLCGLCNRGKSRSDRTEQLEQEVRHLQHVVLALRTALVAAHAGLGTAECLPATYACAHVRAQCARIGVRQ